MTRNIHRPTKIPREPAFWKGTILSVVFHASLIGAIWMAATHHDNGPMVQKVVSRDSAPRAVIAKTDTTASSAAFPERKSVLTGTTESAATGDASSTPANFESAQTDVAAEPKAVITPVAARHVNQDHVAVLIENQKRIETQEKNRKNARAVAKQREELKRAALAQQNRQKTIAEKAEQLAKNRAAAAAMRMATNTQRQKEASDAHAIEKLHQEEMRRLTSGSTGSG